MATSAQRRLLKDLKRIEESGDQIIAMPVGNNLLKWSATIEGIDSTPWEGGLFQLKLEFTENYPNKPPNVKFISEMFHPNIYKDGRICLDMLQNQWSPVYDVWSILTAIRSLLADPNTLSPANTVASSIYKQNKVLYEQRVKQIVERSLDNIKDEDELFQQSQSLKEQENQPNIPEVQVQAPIIRASTLNNMAIRDQIVNQIMHERNQVGEESQDDDDEEQSIDDEVLSVLAGQFYISHESFGDDDNDNQEDDNNEQQQEQQNQQEQQAEGQQNIQNSYQQEE